MCNVQHLVTNHTESQISQERRAALPSPFTGGWLHMCSSKKALLTHILSTLFSSTSVLFSCTPFGTKYIYLKSHRVRCRTCTVCPNHWVIPPLFLLTCILLIDQWFLEQIPHPLPRLLYNLSLLYTSMVTTHCILTRSSSCRSRFFRCSFSSSSLICSYLRFFSAESDGCLLLCAFSGVLLELPGPSSCKLRSSLPDLQRS